MEIELTSVLIVLILLIIYLFINNSNVCSIVRNNKDLFTIGVPGPSVQAMKEADENRNGHLNKQWPPAKAGETFPRKDKEKITTAQWFTTTAEKQIAAHQRYSMACSNGGGEWITDGRRYPLTCSLLNDWNNKRMFATMDSDVGEEKLVSHLLKMINFADGQNTKREREIGERKAGEGIYEK